MNRITHHRIVLGFVRKVPSQALSRAQVGRHEPADAAAQSGEPSSGHPDRVRAESCEQADEAEPRFARDIQKLLGRADVISAGGEGRDAGVVAHVHVAQVVPDAGELLDHGILGVVRALARPLAPLSVRSHAHSAATKLFQAQADASARGETRGAGLRIRAHVSAVSVRHRLCRETRLCPAAKARREDPVL
eukprot:scaffold2249_cov272-Pinguiococcus_pyrenoidosus.AAC.2